uniref:Actin interacting protein 3-like C-terminal domain-containing protein n=1 Tax=Romanomermis culicivorax TaxID=13658 RepID=A0A915I253_ROMCU
HYQELNKRFAGISKYAQDVQRDLTVRKCIIDETKLTKISNEIQKIKIDLGAHSTRVDDLQSTFQQIWEEQLDRVRKQQEVYRNHIASVMCLREDLHRMSTACQQLTPFVRSIAHVIGSITPGRCKSEEQCPMQQICNQINTLEPNSQTRVDAIERQEMQRKQELEKKKDEQDSLIVDVKKKLKTSKDRAKRRSNVDLCAILNNAHSPTNVERERNALADIQIIVPPVNPCKQNRPSIGGNVISGGEDVFDADALCESLLQQRMSLCPTPTHSNNRPKSLSSKSNSISSMASSSVLNLLDTSTDGSEISCENSIILNESKFCNMSTS